MDQNRNKLISRVVGNAATAVVHQILEESIAQDLHRRHYEKEWLHAFALAKKYREMMHPLHAAFPGKERGLIRDKIIHKARRELEARIRRGYTGIDLAPLGSKVESVLQKLRI